MATRRRAAGTIVRDKHTLYELAVQCVEADLDFCERVHRRRTGERPRVLREDFCGTAQLACEWVRRRPENLAVGVDLDRPTLDLGLERHVKRLGPAASRLRLVHGDVLDVRAPKVDLVAALNFSYWVFRDRPTLLRYFRGVRESLRENGTFVLDLFGGTAAMLEETDRRRIAAAKLADGTRTAPFTYVWEQEHFDPITHAFRCHIGFELKDGKKLRRAFSYEWRFWLLPELRELLAEAGFADSDVWVDGWDEKEKAGDGVYRRTSWFENDGCYVGYLVAYRDPRGTRRAPPTRRGVRKRGRERTRQAKRMA